MFKLCSWFDLIGVGVCVNGYLVVLVFGNVIILWIEVLFVMSMIKWFRLNVKLLCGGVL